MSVNYTFFRALPAHVFRHSKRANIECVFGGLAGGEKKLERWYFHSGVELVQNGGYIQICASPGSLLDLHNQRILTNIYMSLRATVEK